MAEGWQSPEIEACILAFEKAWQRGNPPVIAEFLPNDSPSAQTRQLLVELICIDLEQRWRTAAQFGTPVLPLSAYLDIDPQLRQDSEQVLELVGEEYRARQLWGDRPARQTVLENFPHLHVDLPKRLEQIEREIFVESQTDPRFPAVEDSSDYEGQFDPQAPLAYRDYRLQQLIGAGLMGRVYRAWQVSLDRPVAVKYLRKGFHRDREAVERFLREARTVAKLRHPHIIGIHGLGRTPQGGYFLVMDWIDGPDLAQRLKQQRIIPAEEAVRWTLQACRGIQKAHESHIIHCDLKPGNLLLDRDGEIRITDFGLARSLSEATGSDDRIEGTAPFMSPEQVSPAWGPITPRTDIYGLGAVLYCLTTGQPPGQGRTLADVLANVVSAQPIPPANTIQPGLPEPITAICQRCLAKSPQKRFANVLELVEALEQLL